MTTKQTSVTIETGTVGVNFGHAGIIRSVKTRRKLVVTDPCGTEEGARRAAERIAAERGWVVSQDEDE